MLALLGSGLYWPQFGRLHKTPGLHILISSGFIIFYIQNAVFTDMKTQVSEEVFQCHKFRFYVLKVTNALRNEDLYCFALYFMETFQVCLIIITKIKKERE